MSVVPDGRGSRPQVQPAAHHQPVDVYRIRDPDKPAIAGKPLAGHDVLVGSQPDEPRDVQDEGLDEQGGSDAAVVLARTRAARTGYLGASWATSGLDRSTGGGCVAW